MGVDRDHPPPSDHAMLDGRSFVDLAEVAAATPEASVTRVGTTYLATIRRACGELRVAVPIEVVGRGGGLGGMGGIASIGGRVARRKIFWELRPRTQVTWVDGSPAGIFVGGAGYPVDEVEERGDRFCVELPTIAAPVCHAKADATRSTRVY